MPTSLLIAALLVGIDPAGGVFSGRDRQLSVAVPRIEDARIAVDGVLDEEVWDRAARLTDFSEYSPVDGRPADDATEVLVWYSPSAIYFGVKASAAPDSNRGGTDHCTIVNNTLYGNDTHNTGSGRVEVHIADPATNYTTWKMHAATVFSSGDWTNGVFSMHNVYSGGDGDLVFIKTRSTGTGTVELFVASGGGGYGSLNLATPTAYSVGDGGNGWWDLVNA